MAKSRPGSIGNQRALKHGGERAVEKLRTGEEFEGLPAQLEQANRDLLEQPGGAREIRLRVVARLVGLGDLFYGLAQGAIEDGDVEEFDGRVKRCGWLYSSALRALRDLPPEPAPGFDYEQTLAQERGDG